jgi:hypothetical protein
MKRTLLGLPLMAVVATVSAHADAQQPGHLHMSDGMGLLLLACVAVGAWWLLYRRK